jgi:hypothetical protein
VSKRRAKSQASGTPGGQSKSRSYAPTSVHSLDSLATDRLISHSDSSPASSSSSASTQPTDQYTAELLQEEVQYLFFYKDSLNNVLQEVHYIK